MDSQTIDTGLNLSEVAALFRDVVKRRPLVAKASHAEMYTPDVGPWIGVGSIEQPDFAVAVDLTPPNAGAGGTVVLIAEERSYGTRVVVSSSKNSVFNMGGPVKAVRKRLVQRLTAAREPQRTEGRRVDRGGVGETPEVEPSIASEKRVEQSQVGVTSRAAVLPSDIVPMMERFGRHEFDPTGTRATADVNVWEETQQPLQEYAREAPARFVEDLAESVVTAGGWAAYGAAHTVYDLANQVGTANKAYASILDRAIDFLRENHVPPNRVSGFLWNRWIDRGESIETWMPTREIPSRLEASIPDLAPGETRFLAQLTADDDSNRFLVRLDEDGTYRLLIDAVWSADDPRRVQDEWESAASLYEIYVFLGRNLQAVPCECRADLEPYFLLPRSPLVN